MPFVVKGDVPKDLVQHLKFDEDGDRVFNFEPKGNRIGSIRKNSNNRDTSYDINE